MRPRPATASIAAAPTAQRKFGWLRTGTARCARIAATSSSGSLIGESFSVSDTWVMASARSLERICSASSDLNRLPTSVLGARPGRKPGSRVHSELAAGIGRRILDGTYPPGSLLPNEAEWGQIIDPNNCIVFTNATTINNNVATGPFVLGTGHSIKVS